ncbi:MAG TPA: sulfatase [Planctomycetota bacterium]|nr:sulfatase [Planctomycetota bacterium]
MRILYIDIDSLRTDHLSCYGYHRKTSPNIDSIAAKGVRFTNYYASDTPCLPSRTALFGGRLGINSGVVNHGGTNADVRPEGPKRSFRSYTTNDSLAEQLRRAGVYTASITPFPHRHSAYQIWEGFREMFDTGGDGLEPAHVVYPYVERWLRANGSRENWFLHLNMWDPHTPYQVPLELGNPFQEDPPPAWLTQKIIDQHRASYGPHDAMTPHAGSYGKPFKWPRGTDTIRNTADWKKWIDGYDTGIWYADQHVGKILGVLKELGIADSTAILVSADHGENQGELNVYGDHQTADEITNNVPLVVDWPGVTDQFAGRSLDGLHYNVDLAFTLVELSGGKQPSSWDGESFAAALKTGADPGREYLVLSQGAWSCQRSVRWGNYLLIRTYDTGVKNFPALMLFDLKKDPHETNNLAKELPQVVNEGLRIMDAFVGEQLAKSGHPDPLFEVIAEGAPLHGRESLQMVIEWCRATGREAHAEWLEKNGSRPRE